MKLFRLVLLVIGLIAAPSLRAAFVLYNTTTQQMHRSDSPQPYTVDGQAGALPANIVELQVVDQAYPTLGLNERAVRTITVNLQAATYTRGWSIETYTPSADELDERAMQSEAEQFRTLYTALKNNTATAAQQRNILAFLLKCEAKRRGLVAQ